MLDTWIIGTIRTVVPVAVGYVLAYLAVHFGIVVAKDASDGLTLGVAAVLTGVYYAVLHWVEQSYPAVGRWLLALGLTGRQPEYPVRAGLRKSARYVGR
jgi:hypothetical protein